MSTLGKRIKEIRTDAGLKQREFAERLEIKAPYVSQLENDVHTPSHHLVGFICAEFNVNRDWLLHGRGTKYVRKKTLADIPAAAEETMERLREFSRQHRQDDSEPVLEYTVTDSKAKGYAVTVIEPKGELPEDVLDLKACFDLLVDIQKMDPDKLKDARLFLEGMKVGLKPKKNRNQI